MFYAVFLPRWKQFSLVASLNVGSIPAGDVYLAKSGQTRQKSDRNQPIFGTGARAAPLYGLFLRFGWPDGSRVAARRLRRDGGATTLSA